MHRLLLKRFLLNRLVEDTVTIPRTPDTWSSLEDLISAPQSDQTATTQTIEVQSLGKMDDQKNAIARSEADVAGCIAFCTKPSACRASLLADYPAS